VTIPFRHRFSRGPRRGLLVVYAGRLLIGCAASFAADDGSTGGSTGPPATLSAPADADTEALLRKIEQQVSAGRTVFPLDDNATETWRSVVRRKLETHASTGFSRALTEFEARARTRSADKTEAGGGLVAAELTVFADQAIRLMGQIPPPNSSEAEATVGVLTHDARSVASSGTSGSTAGLATRTAPPDVIGAAPELALHDTLPTDPARTEVLAADTARRDTPPPSIASRADFTPERRVPETAGPALAAAMAAVPRAELPAPTREQPMAAFYAGRGDEMLARKDISAARKFYEYAANGGSARAAMALAQTYDATFIMQLGVVGISPDPEQATYWYSKAASDASRGAKARLLTPRVRDGK
jgi:hypothetical protein